LTPEAIIHLLGLITRYRAAYEVPGGEKEG
jgi:hypothetical protein